MDGGTSGSVTRIASDASITPSDAPSSDNTTASVSSWRTIRRRPAPRAMRTDSSPRRAVRRAICRFATLTQAIRSTNETAPSRISSSGRTDSVPCSCKPTARASVRTFGANAPAVVSAPAGAIDGSFTSAVNSASARSCVTPDFMRPSRKRDAFPPVSPVQRLGRKMSASGSAPSRGITGLKVKSGGSTPTTVRGGRRW